MNAGRREAADAPASTATLTAADRRQLAGRGIAVEEARRQLALLATPPPPVRLLRPCRVGDGIRTVAAAEADELAARAEAAARQGRLSKFVPASGAATRMFRAPLAVLNAAAAEIPRAALEAAAGSDAAVRDVLEMVDRLERFAYYPDLAGSLRDAGLDLETCRRQGRLRPILEHLLTPAGLGFGDLPKGLIPFHRHPRGARTPFDEQLAEAQATIADDGGVCRLHFTVPPGAEERFRRRLASAREILEADASGTAFEVSFSCQEPATDTLAGDPEGGPFRLADGSLCFRPGGHGALLGNLARSGGDLVLIKNIDNVLPDRLKAPTVRWKKLLVGLLLEVEEEIDRHLEALAEEADPAVVEAAAAFAARQLAAPAPEGDPETVRRFLLDRLDRPLRVCGMVENRGQPGGGPFWIEGPDGRPSPQIVEKAQIDGADPEQAARLARATHFNPVDLVCKLRDRRGRPYKLARFVDPRTSFVTRKSQEGRPLLALERPGLWNGAMAGWNTLFVEVPPETFAPVKTVLDLLAPEHQG